MKKIAILLAMGSALLFAPIFAGNVRAAGLEKLFVCGPCSSSFLETARAVVEDMGAADLVEVRKTSCLGACSEAPVVEFRHMVYGGMTGDKLRSLLEYELGK